MKLIKCDQMQPNEAKREALLLMTNLVNDA